MSKNLVPKPFAYYRLILPPTDEEAPQVRCSQHFEPQEALRREDPEEDEPQDSPPPLAEVRMFVSSKLCVHKS